MKGSPAKARVVYAPVVEIGGEGRLSRACRIQKAITHLLFYKHLNHPVTEENIDYCHDTKVFLDI